MNGTQCKILNLFKTLRILLYFEILLCVCNQLYGTESQCQMAGHTWKLQEANRTKPSWLVRENILSYLMESTIHKTQSEKLDSIKLKAFSHQKISLRGDGKDKLQTENTNYTSHKRLMPTIFVLDSKKTTHLKKKWVKSLNRHFTTDTQIANRHIRCIPPSQ